jgi:hypothetical protein
MIYSATKRPTPMEPGDSFYVFRNPRVYRGIVDRWTDRQLEGTLLYWVDMSTGQDRPAAPLDEQVTLFHGDYAQDLAMRPEVRSQVYFQWLHVLTVWLKGHRLESVHESTEYDSVLVTFNPDGKYQGFGLNQAFRPKSLGVASTWDRLLPKLIENGGAVASDPEVIAG